MRRTLIVATGVVLALLIGLLYVLVLVLTTGASDVVFSLGVREFEVRLANLALLIMVLAPLGLAILWLLRLPGRIADGSRRRKRERGVEALELALLSAAQGDGRAARREARRAEGLLEGGVGPRLIAAQAAEQMGDVIGAESQYAAMLADQRTELVGRRGLAAAALSRRDFETAILHAREAFANQGGARWAFDLLFDAQVCAAKWDDAVETLGQGHKRKHLADKAARRRRAVLLAANASALERTDPQRARELAEQAASLSPAFAPAAALAARLLVQAKKPWRAASLLEDAWAAAPHPALALAYKDLKPDADAVESVKRLRALAALNADHRESRVLLAEQAIAAGEAAAAADILDQVIADEAEATARVCGLQAQASQMQGNTEDARRLLARAAVAPGEPDWSDLDPEGPAFAYSNEDWRRLVYSFGDTGALIHPRHERFERHRLEAPNLALLEAPAVEVEQAPQPATTGSAPPSPDDPGVE